MTYEQVIPFPVYFDIVVPLEFIEEQYLINLREKDKALIRSHKLTHNWAKWHFQPHKYFLVSEGGGSDVLGRVSIYLA